MQAFYSLKSSRTNVKFLNEGKGRMKGKERKRRFEAQKKRESFLGFGLVVVIAMVAVAGAWTWIGPSLGRSGSNIQGNPTFQLCIDDTAVIVHLHPRLRIFINGKPTPIPANIGISEDCTRPIHTHDSDGVIHVESPVQYPYTLGDFFMVWAAQKFSSTTLVGYTADATHKITMTVNGVVSNQFEKYVLMDNDDIVLSYG